MPIFNRFWVKKYPRKIWVGYSLFFFLFLIFILAFSFIKFPKGKEYTGIYICEENNCFIHSVWPLEEVEKLQKNTEIIVDKKTILLSDITFENPTLENNIVTQEVIMKVPPENYYNYQTITYNVKQGEETIYEMLWKALKGGD